MQILSQTVLRDYQALRAAANSKRAEPTTSEMTGHRLDIVVATVDDDPATPELIVARHWNGDFSAGAAKLTFAQCQHEGKQVLEFSAEQAASFASTDVKKSTALIDMESGFLIASAGNGSFVVSNAAPPVTEPITKPGQPDAQELSIRACYAELKTLAGEKKIGQEFFVEGIGRQVTLDQAEEGFIGISYWGGAFSGPGSGTLTESYREVKDNGRTVLQFTQIDPGDFQGNDASEIQRTLVL
jgi:hypothetical protein